MQCDQGIYCVCGMDLQVRCGVRARCSVTRGSTAYVAWTFRYDVGLCWCSRVARQDKASVDSSKEIVGKRFSCCSQFYLLFTHKGPQEYHEEANRRTITQQQR